MVAEEIFSADSHVLEPYDLWTSSMAATSYAERAPHTRTDDKGRYYFEVDGASPFPMGHAGAAGKSSAELKKIGADSLRTGGWDPIARLEDMAIDGISGEVVYPSAAMSIFQSPDAAYQLACAQVYNDWLVDFCGRADGRLAGVALVPATDIQASVAEITRISGAGLRGVLLPGIPPEGHYAEERFDPLWEAIVGHELPLSFHLLAGAVPGDPTLGSNINLVRMMSVVHLMQQTLSLMMFGGVFDRHPGLRVVSAEHDAGWVAHFGHRLDEMWDRHGQWLAKGHVLKRTPTEYLQSQVWFTFQKDPVAVETRERIGVSQLMWASDYPHSDSTWPESQKVIDADFQGVQSDELSAMLAGNVRTLYRMPRPVSVEAGPAA
jgi:predicted TIM-barrel fold metal-dependent hydrolase